MGVLARVSGLGRLAGDRQKISVAGMVAVASSVLRVVESRRIFAQVRLRVKA